MLRCGVAQGMHGAAAAQHQDAFVPQGHRRFAQGQVAGRVQAVLDGELQDGNVGLGEHEDERRPSAVVQAALRADVAGQSRLLEQRSDARGNLRGAPGRVAQLVEFIGEAVKVVDGFGLRDITTQRRDLTAAPRTLVDSPQFRRERV